MFSTFSPAGAKDPGRGWEPTELVETRIETCAGSEALIFG